MYFDRYDICEAYYLYATLYHNGMGSKEYQIFGVLNKLGFRVSPLLQDEFDLSDNGREIFNRLVNGDSEVRDRT